MVKLLDNSSREKSGINHLSTRICLFFTFISGDSFSLKEDEKKIHYLVLSIVWFNAYLMIVNSRTLTYDIE